MLYDELKSAAASKKLNDGFVFPDQARMYLANPDGITWRVKKVLAAAGFRDEEESSQPDNNNIEKQKSGTLPLPSPKHGNTGIIRGETRVARKDGLRRASVRDFHSFRVTWVTLALTAGVPLELVQKVTGHKTTDIVLKHYFQPGQEAFRQALQSAMPKLLTNGQKSPRDEMREILNGTTVKTWKKDKARMETLLAAL
jgi:integrase